MDQLLDLAAARQELLGALIADSPGEVLKTALPARLAEAMPSEVQSFLEQWLEIEGELQVLHVDAEDPSQSRYVYVLETLFGERFSLHFAKAPPGLLSGTPVGVTGLLLDGADAEDLTETDGAIALDSAESGLTILECCDATGTTAAATAGPELPNTFGEQSTLVILVNFQDDPGNKPYTPAVADSVIFGTTSDFFLENSYGQSWLAGDVVGWYTIPVNSTACNTVEIASLAEDAAAGKGIDLSAYTRYVYIFPENACPFWGAATVGGNPSKAWIKGSLELEVAGHEVGHNFGLEHSHSLVCQDGTTIGPGGTNVAWTSDPWPNCPGLEYGDGLDIMGWSSSAHFNAYQKERLGWLNNGTSPPIVTVDTDGSYSLDAYAADSSEPKALKILKANPEGASPTWYYLEYRQAIGFDSVLGAPWIDGNLMDSGNVLNGVTIHSYYEGNGGNSGYLLDMTPETYQLYTVDPALEVGQSFVDPDGGATITTEWTDAGGATVNVSFGGAPSCIRANPEIGLTPSESLWVEPGTPVTYTLTVTNRDSAACNNASFDLLAAVPAGWTASFGTATLTLAPGASGTTTLDVASPVSEADGFYDITVTVENADDPAFMALAGATYVVSTAVNAPPVAVDDSGTTAEDTPVTIGVLANDWDPNSDTLTVTSVTQGANGSVTINAGSSVTYTPGAGFTGTDSFGYSVSDGQGGSASATVTVTVNAALNTPPVAVDDSGTTAPDTPVTIPVLDNDSDPDGDTLTVVAATQGAKGTVAVNADGTITYTPGRKAKGSDSFTYTISDGANLASATVTIKMSKNGGGGGGGGGGGKGNGRNK